MTEAQTLIAAGVWTVLLTVPGAVGLVMSGGFAAGVGNRQTLPELPEWAARANRAHRNMVENLPVFAAVLLAAQFAGVSNDQPGWGANLFFWARIAHGLVYIAGIPYVRTVAFFAAVSGVFDIARAAWSS